MAQTASHPKETHSFLLAAYGTTCIVKVEESEVRIKELMSQSIKDFGEDLILNNFEQVAALGIPKISFFNKGTEFYCAHSQFCICNGQELISKGQPCVLEESSPWRVSKFNIDLLTLCTAIDGCICNDLSNKEKTITARCVKGETCKMPSPLFKFLHKKVADALKGVYVYGIDVGGVIAAVPTALRCSPEYKNYWQCEKQNKCYCAFPFGYCDQKEYCRISKLKNSCSKVEPDLNQTDVLQSVKNTLMFWKKPTGGLI